MSTNQLNYPAFSVNPNKDRSKFWNGLGLKAGHPEDLSTISDTLLRAPVARYSDQGYIASRPGSGQEAEGKISLAAAQRVLGRTVSEEDEIVVRMLEAGCSPENADTYDATLEVEEIPKSVREKIPSDVADPLMLEKKPDGFEYGKNYDFTILHHGSQEYITADPESIQESFR